MHSELSNFLSYSISNKTQLKQLSGVIDDVAFSSPYPGVVEFTPKQAQHTKSIILSAGIHGNETAPIELLNAMIADLYHKTLSLSHRVLFIFGHLAAIEQQTRFIDENLNRLFFTKMQSKSMEASIAQRIMKTVRAFFEAPAKDRLHYDLHTAIRASKNEKFAVYPYLNPDRQYSKEQLSFLSDCDVNTVLLSQSSANTFSCYSSDVHNAHAFTLELGKVRPFGENDLSKFTKIDTMLRRLISMPIIATTPFDDCPMELFRVNQTIIKQQEDFTLHFPDDAPNFTGFDKGQIIASETGQRYLAEVDGEAIVFPNASVPVGQRALLTVKPCDI